MLLGKAEGLGPARVPCRGSTLPNTTELPLLHQETRLYHTGRPSDSTVLSLYLLLHFPHFLRNWVAIRGVSGLRRRVVSISTSPLYGFQKSLERQQAEIWLVQLSWVKFGSLYYFFKVLGFKCNVLNGFQMRSSHADG